MSFWITLAAYELVWLAAVLGAARGLAWPGVAAVGLFAAWRLSVSRYRQVELRLLAVTVLLALALEGLWVTAGFIVYAAPWPVATAPAWLIGLWLAFALTLVPLFGHLHSRPLLAGVLGAVGGPLAYLAGAKAHALQLPAPLWRGLLALAVGWGVVVPSLTSLAGRWLRRSRAVGSLR